eukprot:364695-Chlamydomonas_euryale.AAC.8
MAANGTSGRPARATGDTAVAAAGAGAWGGADEGGLGPASGRRCCGIPLMSPRSLRSLAAAAASADCCCRCCCCCCRCCCCCCCYYCRR